MGTEPYFCLLYNETVNFCLKSKGHQVSGMLMGMPERWDSREGKKAEDLNSMLPLNCFTEPRWFNLSYAYANNYLQLLGFEGYHLHSTSLLHPSDELIKK